MILEPLERRQKRALEIIKILEHAAKNMLKPMVSLVTDDYGKDPYLILISCLLSLRTRDTVTIGIAKRLFARVRTAHELLSLPLDEVEKLIHGVNFYKRKAYVLKQVSHDIIYRFGGEVPHTEEELLSMNGVGRKTANLVLGEAFGIPAICVDTHVHHIANRLGLVATKTPDQTEKELKKVLPKHDWIKINHLFVAWGQNICVPVSPKCSQCALASLCPKIGVTKHR